MSLFFSLIVLLNTRQNIKSLNRVLLRIVFFFVYMCMVIVRPSKKFFLPLTCMRFKYRFKCFTVLLSLLRKTVFDVSRLQTSRSPRHIVYEPFLLPPQITIVVNLVGGSLPDIPIVLLLTSHMWSPMHRQST